MQAATSTLQELRTAWKAGSPACGPLLSKMKVALLSVGFLPNSGDTPSAEQLLLARETLEIGALFSVKEGDIDAFERYMAQLKAYYFDYRELVADSSSMHELLGLNLLSLLSQNRIAAFHTELERLDPALLHQNVCIKHPVELEQSLMEGAYNRVFAAREIVPAPSYLFFVDILTETIRKEIASCCSKAYDRLKVADAAKLLHLSTSELEVRLGSLENWRIENGVVILPDKQQVVHAIPADKIITRSLDYARDLERII